MGRTYPAIDVQCDDPDILLATVDDFAPTALEERGDSIRVFFATSANRDAALRDLSPRVPVTAIDVPDDDWARRSQEGLEPIVIGRLTVLPRPPSSAAGPCAIVIPASMGFGTGHHATTRLCLEALQAIDLAGAAVLDVGTGSGVLAIAAVRLGAARAVGVDVDEDALQAARDNLILNPDVAPQVTFELCDISSLGALVGSTIGRAPDVIAANLTGALLVRSAPALLDAAGPAGTLILSGVQTHERDAVLAAFTAASLVREQTADEWVALIMKRK